LAFWNGAKFVLDFQIKICGVTCSADAKLAIDLGADAIGINFCTKSQRYVADSNTASEITAAVGKRAKTVGVFVDSNRKEILRCFTQFRLDYVQLHGNETPEFAKTIGFPVIKALPVGSNDFEALAKQIKVWQSLDNIHAVLLDSTASGQFGGSGTSFDWKRVREAIDCPKPLILAGGLNPDNVFEAVNTFCPDAVDVASGVESMPGIKNVEKTKLFIENARLAFNTAH
jgi:phosphoribosylanthranilate isomerase